MKSGHYFLTTFVIVFSALEVSGQGDGLLVKADAGINLINCNSKEALDRVRAAGIQGWMPLDVSGR